MTGDAMPLPLPTTTFMSQREYARTTVSIQLERHGVPRV
jgi:hypothetical protein